MKSSPSPGNERESRRGNRASSDAGVNDSANDRGTFAAGAVRAQLTGAARVARQGGLGENIDLVECKGCHRKLESSKICEECGGCLEVCCLCDVPNSDEEYDEIVGARGV